jgi:hypothetical protein
MTKKSVKSGACPLFLKIAPLPPKVKRGYQITSFLRYMYEYFTFAHYLSFIEDRVKSNNSGISPAFLLAHLLHLN